MAVKVVVLGAGGLVGARLCDRLAQLETLHVSPTETQPIGKIVLFDVREPSAVAEATRADARVHVVLGDLTDKAAMQKVLDPEDFSHVTAIHLAALLSGYAEENFDLGLKINLFGSINVMECVRELKDKLGKPQVYVYVSTDYVACFNEYNRTHPVTEESFRLSPVSYGVQKACVELLLCDYTRKGFIDGRVGRLSAVIGRPGWSNSISYPYTGIFTQTLEGKDYDVPLPMDVPYPCSSLNTDVLCLIDLAGKVDGEEMGHNRVVQLPAKSFTLQMIWDAAQEVAKEEGIAIGAIKQVQSDSGSTTVKEINVCPEVDCSKAASLGLPTDVDLKDIVRDYVHTYIKK
ncbi:nucleoside-diphosphate-sugar epimerase [Salpingoeca rosetta]|uniref:Nucleoside-diphosphate-sugar epimerase n=1 Tax=Salpingoeca rosetta (strain ATCC 50818 / BSB-021) TaxID=946362 RepID=F2UE67_SALR5|nr:nucleoside-diphosphate-sugar epimerase [Salpingoeca rosetta]EGD74917.1 nucleoside-diphosphate-sugar epimerase [Salpingoeca rosetta]|eukprot:XP_004992562.1 nucleoside-diphosphate-sugar epimerase [Salpingoeca rosetta]